MKNTDRIQQFLNKKSTTRSLWSDGERLWSYNTVIAQWCKDFNRTLIINPTKYSVTTSIHLRLLLGKLPPDVQVIYTADNLPKGVIDLHPNNK